jgi:SAM-dependent methyltransferase
MSGRITAPVPTRLLRDLLGKASGKSLKVLDVGCSDGALVAELKSLGMDAVGIDDSLSKTSDGLHAGSLAANLPFPAHSMDLVLVRGMKVFGGELAGPEVFTSTANLLSCLKPTGRLILFEPMSFAGTGSVNAARLNAWRDHLSRFPGKCSTRQYADGLGFLLSLKWLLGDKKISATIVTMTIDAKPMSRLEWHRVVRDILIGKGRRGAA